MRALRGGVASTSGRSWAEACLRSTCASKARVTIDRRVVCGIEPRVACLSISHRHAGMQQRTPRQPTSMMPRSEESHDRMRPGGPGISSWKPSRSRAQGLMCTAARGGRLGGTWQLEKPAPAWWTWVTLRMPLLGSPQLLQRIMSTVFFLALTRLGMFIPLPGLSSMTPSGAGAAAAGLAEDIFGLRNSIFQLGIGPYIDASWTLSIILLVKFPHNVYVHLQALRRAGREGHAVMKMYIQVGSLLFAALLGAKRAVELLRHATVQQGFITRTMLCLVAGAMLLRFVADQNQDYGLGDGIALLICSGMASAYGTTFSRLPALVAAAAAPQWALPAVAAACLALVYAAVYVTQIEKRLPLVYYKRRKQALPQESAPPDVLPPAPPRTANYMPMRLTPAGMTPLLMASWLFNMVPHAVATVSPKAAILLANTLLEPSVLPWSFGAFVLVTMLLDFSGGSMAREIADWMSAVDAGIKGVSPGSHTEEFLMRMQSLMRVWGGLAVAGLAVAAHLFDDACTRVLGFNLNSIMLLMITGYVTTSLRQAQSLMQLPRLSRALARERAVLSAGMHHAGREGAVMIL